MSVPALTAVGTISGTSMDGIDVASVETDGTVVCKALPGITVPYAPELRARLLAVLTDPAQAERAPLSDLERDVTIAHADAVDVYLKTHPAIAPHVTLVGLHGQTIWHNPAARFTRQLLDGHLAAQRLGRPVVTRFRHADVAAGGQGAPFAPLYHAALARDLAGPVMVLNWGGVGNITYIHGDTIIAFDTGPASALIDDWMLTRRGVPYDAGGALAATGRVDAARVARWMTHAYFRLRAPKSLDRQEFHRLTADAKDLADADGAATLAAFTIEATAAALDHVPRRPARWLVTGGGRHNAHLMGQLAVRLGVSVEPVESVGWMGDVIEAQCFAFLAVRSVRGLPLSLPTTTGVPRPMTGGETFDPRP
jgi:anhydro-N-acetylmuramic acid kinase